ncbi:hypothetical protein F4009_01875 [Candidatus Poribacteria bacterium]|nr:hypothetical protein [Candidatus Poribacteria bacterium]MYH83018.1 hypothetical protein [Candidatus Poribacteria bacterium]MYK92749.1 hypothetical protein [Candidatus Poribacteria bacterium]
MLFVRQPMNLKVVRWDIVGVSLGLFGCLLTIVTVNLTLRAEDNAHRVTEAYQGFQDGKCKSCHPAIWREWENSMHAKAWVDEIYQAAAKQVPDRKTKCDQCHAPQPILITGVGKMPKLRDKQREAGVSCLVCHLDAHGAMNGPPASAETYFHANVTNPIYTEPTVLCGTCHGQQSVPEHDQVSSFLKSKFAEGDASCATCHMPVVTRLQSTTSHESIKGRKHTWRGSRSVAQLKRAATLQLGYVDGKADVKLRSQTGHILPGGTLRTIVLEVTRHAPDGTQLQKQQISISAKNENRLFPNENRAYAFDIPSATTGDTIKARLIYQLTPDTPEPKRILMAEKTHIVP